MLRCSNVVTKMRKHLRKQCSHRTFIHQKQGEKLGNQTGSVHSSMLTHQIQTTGRQGSYHWRRHTQIITHWLKQPLNVTT